MNQEEAVFGLSHRRVRIAGGGGGGRGREEGVRVLSLHFDEC